MTKCSFRFESRINMLLEIRHLLKAVLLKRFWKKSYIKKHFLKLKDK